MTFNSFRQDAWNDRVVETMTFKSFRLEGWNDRVERQWHLIVSDRKPGMIEM